MPPIRLVRTLQNVDTDKFQVRFDSLHSHSFILCKRACIRLFACEGRLSSFSAVSKSHGVRYLSAGLNNLKSDLNMSVNYSTSVNVDLSMSLNCSFLLLRCILDMACNYVLCTEITKVRFLAGD